VSTAKVHTTDVDDRSIGGEPSPGEPLEISAVVYPESAAGAAEDVEVRLEVKEGKGPALRSRAVEME
jgi:hypothetical protein